MASNRHVTIVDMVDHIIKHKAAAATPAELDEVAEEVNQLFGYMLDAYTEIPVFEHLETFLEGKDNIDIKKLTKYPEDVIPVAVAQYLINNKSLQVTRLDRNIQRFYHRYNPVLDELLPK